MKSVKFSKEDQAAIMKSLDEQDFETFISYFRNTDLIVECEYMLTRQKQKLAPTENAQFTIGRVSYYVQITEMIKIKIQNEWAGFIKGRIYFKPEDIDNRDDEFQKLQECTSKDLFLTDITQWFLSTTFVQKIKVDPIDMFVEGTIVLDDDHFYTRAEYNTKLQEFNPPINEWLIYCNCKRLYDPKEDYILCEFCNNWIHYTCSGKSDKELKNISKIKFICLACVDQNQNKKKKLSNVQEYSTQDGDSTKIRSFNTTHGKKKK
ncbi:unnamed protein product (macronuclear) [Paramecium tetraurelia]|uniref:Zinc finger PHD-type domain-containing protein n=1 Tax=Paramecium tetraurelia TaxID=5888 RepID=A0C688_PARTE|nr:uncharacterized protein GSPATT00035434001 [Paramecium tetraurelia]CAK66305.1 unnamed protein product [Paramecium tetraurelia]|eukprot:XP_001433702.1 hypothetical protein (macronuclear) [Paramecium tetraurelia strain d4-2]